MAIVYFWKNREELPMSLNLFYQSVGVSKQGIHKMLNRIMQKEEAYGYLGTIISQIRGDHPTMSCRAMYHKIKPEGIGRDRFESLCKQWGYMSPVEINFRRTTDSYGVYKFENLLEKESITFINQAFVSDITYFDVCGTFYYITFVMDAFSRYILGYSVSSRLTTEQTTLKALSMAIKKRKKNLPNNIIFHSDCGGQYYDKGFLSLTKRYGFRNSMCEYAWQNGKAERINGIIKNNYLKYWDINNYLQLNKGVDRSVSLYNNEKPHKALSYKTPLEVEKICLNLLLAKQPMAIESLDANNQIYGASSPNKSEAKQPLAQDVLPAIIY